MTLAPEVPLPSLPNPYLMSLLFNSQFAINSCKSSLLNFPPSPCFNWNQAVPWRHYFSYSHAIRVDSHSHIPRTSRLAGGVDVLLANCFHFQTITFPLIYTSSCSRTSLSLLLLSTDLEFSILKSYLKVSRPSQLLSSFLATSASRWRARPISWPPVWPILFSSSPQSLPAYPQAEYFPLSSAGKPVGASWSKECHQVSSWHACNWVCKFNSVEKKEDAHLSHLSKSFSALAFQ